VNEETFLQGLEGLVHGLASWLAKDQLALQAPVERDVPGGGDLLVDQRVVVLQVGAETFLFKGRPDGKLMHGIGVLAPLRELVGIQGEVLLQVRDGLGVFVEQHGAVGGLEPAEFLLRGCPGFFGRNGLDGGLDDVTPQFLVLVAEKDDDAGGLGVEAAGDVQDGLLDDLLDLGIRHRGLRGELVDCAAGFDGLEEGG